MEFHPRRAEKDVRAEIFEIILPEAQLGAQRFKFRGLPAELRAAPAVADENFPGFARKHPHKGGIADAYAQKGDGTPGKPLGYLLESVVHFDPAFRS
jgi:hypothetical protein